MYRNSDGTYSYTAPVPGGPLGIEPSQFNPIPPGGGLAGDYHTHGAFDPALNPGWNSQPGTPGYRWTRDANEVFSGDDISGIESEYGVGFLGTPRGTIQEYVPILGNPGRGTVTILTNDSCECSPE